MALIPWSFHFETKQLEKLRELSKRTRVPQSVFVREGLDYVLKKYSFLLTLTPFSPSEALAKMLGEKYEETIEEWVSKTGLSRPDVEMSLLRQIIEPKHTSNDTKLLGEKWKPRKKRRSWQSLLMDSAKRDIEESDTKMRMAKLDFEKKISKRGLTELSNKGEENP